MQKHQRQPNLDTVTTINEDGSRYMIHPADNKGKFTLYRRITAYVLIAIYVITPWIQIDGFPAVFLDIKSRKFHLFGLTLLTNDLWLLLFLITGLAFTLFVLSAVVGRVWCGWYCPYTVFLEHVYRRIERLILGDAQKRRKLDQAPSSGRKLLLRAATWASYILISFLLAHVFLSYFISLPELWKHILSGPLDHMGEFGFILAFTGVFSFMFGWFREQFCIILCPYGRFQSALTDDDTVTVAYDYKRGEPRGKKRKKSDTSKEPIGDCVDCRRCVNVCPTGIDIRNGIQLECVACSGCIDACDDIMTKLGRPKGLIRYDSLNGIETGKKKIFRPRLLLYALFLLLGASVFSLALYSKAKPFHASVLRMPGSNYTSAADGVRNMFNITITNKRHKPQSYTIDLIGSDEIHISQTEEITIGPLEKISTTVRVFIEREDYTGAKDIKFSIKSKDGSEVIRDARFTGPNQHLYKKQYHDKTD